MSEPVATQRDLAVSLIERHGIMRLSDLKDRGVNPATLARLVEEGVLHRPSRGLYVLAGVDIEISHSLAEVAKRVPKGVICLVSALQFHEITLAASTERLDRHWLQGPQAGDRLSAD